MNNLPDSDNASGSSQQFFDEWVRRTREDREHDNLIVAATMRGYDSILVQSATTDELRELLLLGLVQDMAPKPTPTPTRPCSTCQHYIGTHVPGGQLRGELCCAMYPYGPEGSDCEDWEQKREEAQQQPQSTLTPHQRQQLRRRRWVELMRRHRGAVERLALQHQSEMMQLEIAQRGEREQFEAEYGGEDA